MKRKNDERTNAEAERRWRVSTALGDEPIKPLIFYTSGVFFSFGKNPSLYPINQNPEFAFPNRNHFWQYNGIPTYPEKKKSCSKIRWSKEGWYKLQLRVLGKRDKEMGLLVDWRKNQKIYAEKLSVYGWIILINKSSLDCKLFNFNFDGQEDVEEVV